MKAQPVIGSIGQVLTGAEIALGRLNGRVPKHQLDLLQFPAPAAAQLGAGSAEVVRP
jgi:hypothetical protein